MSAPKPLRKARTNNSSAVAIRFIGVNLDTGAITRRLSKRFRGYRKENRRDNVTPQ
jgi:hypothetical protein